MIEQLFSEMDEWVSRHGNGTWVLDDFNFRACDGDHGIQQNRKELMALVSVLLERPRGTMLEIGLGHHGGTHTLWRKLYERVIEIDSDVSAESRFRTREGVTDNKSIFVIGDSGAAEVVAKVRSITDSIDFLFIDGGHLYENVKADYLNYGPLVKPGGIIAWHDTVCQMDWAGVKHFLYCLTDKRIDGKEHTLHQIVVCPQVGTAGVSRVHGHDRHAGQSRFVLHERPELPERPARMSSPLPLSNRCPVAYALQVLQGNPASGAFSGLTGLFGNDRV